MGSNVHRTAIVITRCVVIVLSVDYAETEACHCMKILMLKNLSSESHFAFNSANKLFLNIKIVTDTTEINREIGFLAEVLRMHVERETRSHIVNRKYYM